MSDAVYRYIRGDFDKVYLGTPRTHRRQNGDTWQNYSVRVTNGFYVDISKVESIPRDMTAIRMNVDNFKEAYDLLTAHGFRKAPGIEEVDMETAKALLMVAPSGFAIEVIEHIKD